MGSYTPVDMAMVPNINEELADMPNDNMDATGSPDQSAMITDDNDQPESAQTEHNGPIHDRCVHGEINAIFVPLDKSEIYFRMAHPYELLPLSKYYLQEWSEVEHLLLPAIDFAEEIFGDSQRPKMVTELSIMNDNNQNNSNDENAEQDEIMMEVDGQADVELNKPLEHGVGEENDANFIIQKRREYYLRATNTADASDAGDTIDTVIIFDTLETVETANTVETRDTAEQSDFMSFSSREIDDYLEGEDFKPILRITQEQLLIDWLTSRHILNKNESDE